MNRGDSRKTPALHKETVEEFARNMANEIVQSLQMETEDLWDLKERKDKKNVIETASKEVGKGQKQGTLRSQGSSNDENVSAQAPPTLPRSGLPILGSLDYPDAPPSTPLVPETLTNRQSFARKLKGGLAKEFAPSPPPPTPKDDGERARFDAKAELVQHLMHSLEESAERGEGRTVATFAEALSLDVMAFAREEVGQRFSVERLATQMAKTIVKCSLDEVKHC